MVSQLIYQTPFVFLCREELVFVELTLAIVTINEATLFEELFLIGEEVILITLLQIEIVLLKC